MNKQRKNSGFTLLELIIVIAILAILSTISIPAYNSYQTKARENVLTNNCAQVAEIIQLMELDNDNTNSSSSNSNSIRSNLIEELKIYLDGAIINPKTKSSVIKSSLGSSSEGVAIITSTMINEDFNDALSEYVGKYTTEQWKYAVVISVVKDGYLIFAYNDKYEIIEDSINQVENENAKFLWTY